jgi:hypothetical protein
VLSLYQGDDGHFSSLIALEEGDNIIHATAMDDAGNKAITGCTVVYDLTSPVFDSIRFSGGFITNNPITTATGTLSESGSLSVNGKKVDVNSDGTFSHILKLNEGVNTLHFQFTDLAGNIVDDWQNVTLDTVAPIISLTTQNTIVDTDVYELTGSVEAGADVFINGKRTTVGTRQSGEFSATLTLSPGINLIVIEAEDSAGNTAQYTQTVNYDANAGATDVNWGAIGLMIALLVVGLVLGLLFGGMLGGGEPEPQDEEEPPEEVEELQEEVQEDMLIDEEIPSEESPEDIAETEEDLELEDEEIPELMDAEPIPAEEGLPEELPEEEPVDISDDIIDAPAEDEDPRIQKLREAFESGKISEELFKKNLERFQNQ